MVHRDSAVRRVLGYAALASALGACGAGEVTTESVGEVQNALVDNVFTDATGDVKIQVRTCDYPASASSGSRCQFCAVDRGWVVVGGGAEIEGSPADARLRSSLPNPDWLTLPVRSPDGLEACTGNVPNNDADKSYTAWMARSEGTSSYRMRTYVIGLQVAGMTETELRAHVHYADNTTVQLTQPSVERDGSGVDPGGVDYLLLGGGADEVGSRNCFLTESRPSPTANAWRASAYCGGAPGALKTYGIFLRRCLPAPGWAGCMEGTNRSIASALTSGYGVASVATPFPWVTTSIGGRGVVGGASSRFLADLLPLVGTEDGASVSTKEGSGTVSGSTSAYSVNLLGGRWGTHRYNVLRFAHPVAQGGGLSLSRPAGSAPVSLQQATLTNAAPYRWSLEALGSGQYRLRNANPNVPAQGECAFRDPGTSSVKVGPCATSSEYKWTFVGDPTAAWFGFKLRNVSSGTCLDNNASTSQGSVLSLAACADGFSSRQSLYLGSLQWPG
jgi:hypothetical protein